LKHPALLAVLLAGSFLTSYLLVRSARQQEAKSAAHAKSSRTASETSRKPSDANSSNDIPKLLSIDDVDQAPSSKTKGMVLVPGGVFMMGSESREANSNERPAHRVRVSPFWIDITEVTNVQFRRFVEATGYTTTAERPIDWDELKKNLPPDTPKPPADKLVPGSMVFTPPDHPIGLDNFANWWSWVPGASWKHPEGPGSTLEGRDDHPVVHISWDDATAYARWAGKRLPTEAEWEFAARGGLEGRPYAWGDELCPEGKLLANTWQGRFPDQNLAEDRFARTAPVRSFPANAYGLYDMIGNVWEWCSDWYRPDAYSLSRTHEKTVVNPSGPESSFDPNEPLQPKRVTRGGSFLCSPGYCSNYRPSARQASSPDSGMSHIGFRCVISAERKPRDADSNPRR
jgi:formylglycine-generating enzyme required for sulfatase activity